MKLNEIIQKPPYSFDSLFNQDVEILTFDIDCSLLSEPLFDNTKFADYDKQGKMLKDGLEKVLGPSIYWFEIEGANDCSDVIRDLNAYRASKSGHSVPVKNKNCSSKVLYVGVRRGGIRKDRQTNIAGRLGIHLGFYKVGSTQGLQLCHWAKAYKFKINVIVLPYEAEIYLNVLEKQLANKLKPMCGRHR